MGRLISTERLIYVVKRLQEITDKLKSCCKNCKSIIFMNFTFTVHYGGVWVFPEALYVIVKLLYTDIIGINFTCMDFIDM